MPLAVSRAASAATGTWGTIPTPSHAGPVLVSEWMVGMLRKTSVSPTRKVLAGWEVPAVFSPMIIARPIFFMIYTNSSAAPAVAPLVRMRRLLVEPNLVPKGEDTEEQCLKRMEKCLVFSLFSHT